MLTMLGGRVASKWKRDSEIGNIATFPYHFSLLLSKIDRNPSPPPVANFLSIQNPPFPLDGNEIVEISLKIRSILIP